jgi:hypothetical protein
MLTDDIVALRALKTFEDQSRQRWNWIAAHHGDGLFRERWRVGLSDQSARYLIEKQ